MIVIFSVWNSYDTMMLGTKFTKTVNQNKWFHSIWLKHNEVIASTFMSKYHEGSGAASRPKGHKGDAKGSGPANYKAACWGTELTQEALGRC
jgi:hypothetical protein